MGLILKKDESEHEVIEGIEVIERSDVPDDLPENPVELVSGASAEDIASGDDEAQDAQDEGIDADGLDDEDGREPASGDGGDGGDDGDDADDEPLDADDDEPAHTGVLANVPRGVKIGGVAALIIVAVVAAVIGYVIGSGGFGGTGTGTATVGEGQLDTVIASYTYNGASHDITVRSAIESEYSLDIRNRIHGIRYALPAES